MPQEAVSSLRSSFNQVIYLTDVSSLPIGAITRGKNTSWSAYLLQIGSSSASLLGKGSTRKTHNSDRSELFISGIQSLMINPACSSVSFLVHWMQGLIAAEEITIKQEQQIRLQDTAQFVLNLEEDVRYVVLK